MKKVFRNVLLLVVVLFSAQAFTFDTVPPDKVQAELVLMPCAAVPMNPDEPTPIDDLSVIKFWLKQGNSLPTQLISNDTVMQNQNFDRMRSF